MSHASLIAFLLLTTTSPAISDDGTNQELIATSSNQQVLQNAQYLDGNNIAISRTENNKLFVSFYDDSKKIFELDLGNHLTNIDFIQLAFDQKIYLIGKKGNAPDSYMVSIDEGKVQEPKILNLQNVQDIQMSPDGRLYILGDNQKIVVVEGNNVSLPQSYGLAVIKSMKIGSDRLLYIVGKNSNNENKIVIVNKDEVKEETTFEFQIDKLLLGRDGFLYLQTDNGVHVFQEGKTSMIVGPNLANYTTLIPDSKGNIYAWGKNQSNRYVISIIINGSAVNFVEFPKNIQLEKIDQIVAKDSKLVYLRGYRDGGWAGPLPILAQMRFNDDFTQLNEKAKVLEFLGVIQEATKIALSADGTLYVLERERRNSHRTSIAAVIKDGKNIKLGHFGLYYIKDIQAIGDTLYIKGVGRDGEMIISLRNGEVNKIKGTSLLEVRKVDIPLRNILEGTDNIIKQKNILDKNGVRLWHSLKILKDIMVPEFMTIEDRKRFYDLFNEILDQSENYKIIEDVINFLSEISTKEIDNPAYKEANQPRALNPAQGELIDLEGEKSDGVRLASSSYTPDETIDSKVSARESIPKTIPHPFAPYAAAILFNRYDFLNPNSEYFIFLQSNGAKKLSARSEKKKIALKLQEGLLEISKEQEAMIKEQANQLYNERLANTQYALSLLEIINRSQDHSLREQFAIVYPLVNTAIQQLSSSPRKNPINSNLSTTSIPSSGVIDSIGSFKPVNSLDPSMADMASSSISSGSFESERSLDSTGDTASTHSHGSKDSFADETSITNVSMPAKSITPK